MSYPCCTLYHQDHSVRELWLYSPPCTPSALSGDEQFGSENSLFKAPQGISDTQLTFFLISRVTGSKLNTVSPSEATMKSSPIGYVVTHVLSRLSLFRPSFVKLDIILKGYVWNNVCITRGERGGEKRERRKGASEKRIERERGSKKVREERREVNQSRGRN